MRACYVMISTSTDGDGTEIVREGKLDLFPGTANIHYKEENAQVSLSIHDHKAEVIRRGDYTLRLSLEQGKITSGSIGIGENEGNIRVYTYEITYRIAETFVAVSLRYDLLIGEEKQEMILRLLAHLK